MKDQKHTISATPELAALLRRYQAAAVAAEESMRPSGARNMTLMRELGEKSLAIVEAMLDAEIVDHLERELPKWHSVDDQLPIKGLHLVYGSSETSPPTMRVDEYDGEWGWTGPLGVTHWRELPLPPEEM